MSNVELQTGRNYVEQCAACDKLSRSSADTCDKSTGLLFAVSDAVVVGCNAVPVGRAAAAAAGYGATNHH